MQTCPKCGETKSLAEFYKRRGGHFASCKLCVLASRRERYERDGDVLRARVRRYQTETAGERDQRRAEKRAQSRENELARGRRNSRERYLVKTYGITQSEFEEMFAAQGGRCAICESDDPTRHWTVDHDHLTGAVRGILCWHCNVGLGHFRDDALNIVAAADYLLSRNAVRGVA